MTRRYIETYFDEVSGAWRNRVVGQCDLPGEHEDEEDAVHLGRHEAIRRGLRHRVRRPGAADPSTAAGPAVTSI